MLTRTCLSRALHALLPCVLLVALPGSADGPPREKLRDFESMVSVRRHDASRTIHVELIDESASSERAARRKQRLGKIKVKNKSPFSSAIYWSLDDAFTPWFYVDTLPPGWKVKFKLPKKEFYLLAAEDPFLGDNGFWEWGPRSVYLKKRFKWTLFY